jgi:hypothetical protein
LPLIEIGLLSSKGKGLRTWALLDSGAGINLFPLALAGALGLDWENAPTCPVAGITGATAARVLPVELLLCDARHAWIADVGFMGGPLPIALLGRHGFFEHFEIRFKLSARAFRIHLN